MIVNNLQVNPLLDLDFIDQLHHKRIRKTYARIIALNIDEEPLETIEGIITNGSINVDGDSAVRRTCNLSMVCEELNIHEYYWGLKTKVRLFTGLENTINPDYPDIIWFPQGTFVLSTFSTQQGLGQYIINLQGKDKMTLLNGELGGIVYSLTWDFGTASVVNADGSIIQEKILLKEIIRAAVHTYAKMPLYKIHINDLDDMGLELMEYKGKEPLYVIIRVDNTDLNMTLNKNQMIGDKCISDDDVIYDPLFDLEQVGGVGAHPTIFTDEKGIQFRVAKLTYGMTAGYRLTNLVYAGDLILNVGETITSLLDKIVAMLGDYEYFFDLNGEFWFQRKKAYLQTRWANVNTNDLQEQWSDPNAFTSAITYYFNDAELITNYANSPNFQNLRNDFSIWGTRRGTGDKNLPVHLRFAIDDKPIEYVNYEGIKFTTMNENGANIKSNLDWREIIYQMAQDYNKHHLEDDFYLTIYKNNPATCKNGITGYEQYYVDLDGFWRELYNPFYEGSYQLESMSKAKYQNAVNAWYENQVSNFPYYYKVPLYINCKINEPFHSEIQYYIKNDDGNYSAVHPSKIEYETNQTQYWYVDPVNYDYKTCIIEEGQDGEWRSCSNGNYRAIQQNLQTVYWGKNSENQFDNNKYNNIINKWREQNLIDKEENMAYQKLIKIDYKPCFVSIPIQTYYTYYYMNDNVETAIAGSEIDKDDYFNNPGKYYRYEYQYYQCSNDDAFDSSIDYYVKGTASRTDQDIYQLTKMVTSTGYAAEPTRYYIRSDELHKVFCYTAILPDDYLQVCAYINGLPHDNNNLEDKEWNIYSDNPAEILAKLNKMIEEGEKPYAFYVNVRPTIHPIDYSPNIVYYTKINDEYSEDGWANYVSQFPETLNFWFDFLDEQSELTKYSNRAIGNRAKAVNDNNVKSIYFRETPTIIFVDNSLPDQSNSKLGYTYVNLPPTDLLGLFSISSQGKSAKSVLDSMLYQYACCAEQISFNTIPYYNLEPNKRIFVSCPESGINGEYIMTKFTIPLGPSGNMSINANKAIDTLY